MDIITTKRVFLALIGIGLFSLMRKKSSSPVVRTANSPSRGLAVGDSITAHGRYVSVLRERTGYQWDTLAEVGWRTSQMLTALRRADLSKYSTIVILGGVNDFVNERLSASDISWNLAEMMRIAKQAGVPKIVIVTTTPWAEYRSATQRALAKQSDLNAWIKTEGAAFATGVVDTSVLGSRAGSLLVEYAAPDGLHLNRTGQTRLGNLIAEELV